RAAGRPVVPAEVDVADGAVRLAVGQRRVQARVTGGGGDVVVDGCCVALLHEHGLPRDGRAPVEEDDPVGQDDLADGDGPATDDAALGLGDGVGAGHRQPLDVVDL